MKAGRCLIVLLLLSIFAMGQNNIATSPMNMVSASPMSYEESIVRATYGRLTYAAQVGTIMQIANQVLASPGSVDWPEFSRRMNEGEITFELSNMRIGQMSEIANVPYAELVTKPDAQDIIVLAHGIWGYAGNRKTMSSAIATPSWSQLRSIPTGNWNVPFETAFQVAENSGAQDPGRYQRFATFAFLVLWHGPPRRYHALFAFGWDEKATDHILAVDAVTRGLQSYVQASVYPVFLLDAQMRSIPFVAQWLR